MTIDEKGDAIEQIRQLLSRGNCLAAYDLSKSTMEETATGAPPESLAYLRVLALAQTGAIGAALSEYDLFNLDRSNLTDVRALKARLYKDLALNARNKEEREKWLIQSAHLYQKLFQETRSYYPGINAATLQILLGENEKAQSLAKEVSQLAAQDEPTYWSLATLCEAALILDNIGDAMTALSQAYDIAPSNRRWHASTWRNLSALLSHLHMEADQSVQIRDCLHIANIAVYCGHMYEFAHSEEDKTAEENLRKQIGQKLKTLKIGTLYGSLACGSDILVAEIALDLGIDLHLILPFDEEDFFVHSIDPGGVGWRKRYHAVKQRAQSFRCSTDQPYLHDPWQFTFASLHMQGLALMQARHLQVDAHLIAVWDGKQNDGVAGTAADIRAWQQYDRQVHIIPFAKLSRNLNRPSSPDQPIKRLFRALIFSDFAGFSKLSEYQYRHYAEDLLYCCSEVLKRYKNNIISQNSWGDALFIILDDPLQAASLCQELELAITHNLASSPIGDTLKGVRISAHYGPVYETRDSILNQKNCFGALVSETARMEPATPTGAIFVSETFACALEMSGTSPFECAFVGTTRLAKNYGARRLYQLRPRA